MALSIEFGHIYTDESPGEEHVVGAGMARGLLESLGGPADVVVLVDNYNPEIHTLSIEDYLRYLNDQSGVVPDAVAYESDMVGPALDLMKTMPDGRIRRSYERYLEVHEKLPCSLLTTAWYLVRLGQLRPRVPIDGLRPADELINILPARFDDVERKVMENIAAYRPELISQIRHMSIADTHIPVREYF